jgi:inosine/xanthosine triphosphatase
MKVVVASNNPVKLAATRSAFGLVFPGLEPEVAAIDVDSGVSAQPFSDEETRHGAINRAHNAAETVPDADFWIGLEGGVDQFNGQLMTFAWTAVLDRHGRTGTARTVTLPLPPEVKRLVEGGLELGEANDRVFATVNSKQEGGAFGLLTQGRLTRGSVYAETLSIALIPFVNELY